MGRLGAVIGALVGVLLVPLALVSPTYVLLLPAHLIFTALAVVAAVLEGLAGRPERARLWGFGHLVASIAMIGALELGARVSGTSWWVLPWILVLLWGWLPISIAGLSGWAGEYIRQRRSDRAVRLRRQARRLS